MRGLIYGQIKASGISALYNCSRSRRLVSWPLNAVMMAQSTKSRGQSVSDRRQSDNSMSDIQEREINWRHVDVNTMRISKWQIFILHRCFPFIKATHNSSTWNRWCSSFTKLEQVGLLFLLQYWSELGTHTIRERWEIKRGRCRTRDCLEMMESSTWCRRIERHTLKKSCPPTPVLFRVFFAIDISS